MCPRKLLPSAALVLLTAVAQGQDKGFVSGTISFVNTKDDNPGSVADRTNSSFTFGPAVGYNLNASNVVGLALSYSGSKSTAPQTFTDINGNPFNADLVTKQHLFEIAPFYRYVKSVGEKFSLYGQLKVGVGFGKNTTEYPGTLGSADTKVSTIRAGIGPGIVFVPATRWALSADWGLIGYRSTTEKVELDNTDQKTTTSGFEATLDPGAITLALNWLF